MPSLTNADIRKGKPKPKKRGKKSRKPVKKVSSRGSLIKKAHSIIRDIVMDRDNGCVCPPPKVGHSSIRQAGHVIPSTSGGCRFSLWNIHEQCSGCNGRHSRANYWHIYQEWFERTFGSERWLAVQDEKKNDGLKTREIEDLIIQLQAIRQKQLRDLNWKPYFTQAEILSGEWSK